LNSIKKQTSIDVKSSSEYGDWVKESVLEPKPLSSIYLEDKHVILDDVHNFLDSEEWYKKNHIIYKRGYLLTGPPGNGKTSFIMSLAKELKRTINFLNLNNVGDKAIRDLFRNLKSNSILVIEDIDAAFSSRDNEKSIRFSFSTLLNCLDGVFSKENIIVIFTSNHPEKLDAALIREGRVDRKFEFKNPSVDVISSYLSDQFGEPIDFSDYIDEYSQKLPMVGVQNTVFSNRGKTVLEVANAIYEKDRDFDPDKYKLKVNDKDGSENDH
jgi:AAA+ superfamily predicted ATPase